VVLLDEIEKAHPDVWNMMLQIMEEGRLTDNVGRAVDFRNTVFIMTTNLGAESIVRSDDLSDVFTKHLKRDNEVSYQDMKKKVMDVMTKVFRPEFLNRFDDIIVFRGLTKENLKQIVDMELDKVSKRMKEKGLAMVVTEAAKEFLIEKGSSLELGARPLRRAVEQHMEDALAESLLRGEFAGKDTVTVVKTEVDGEEKLSFETTDSPVAEALVAGAESKA